MMFEESVTTLRNYIQHRTQGKCSPPWNWLLVKLVSLLSRYPAGITKAIILAEIQQSWYQYSQYRGRIEGKKTRYVSVDSVCDSRHIGYESILEAAIEDIHSVPGTLTKIAVLRDCTAERNTIGMYLHQKLYQVQESYLLKCTLRFTSCRLIRGQGLSSVSQKLCLLPTENVVILYEEGEELPTENVSSLRAIAENPYPHYTHDIHVDVVDLGNEETVHFANGQTSVKRCVKVVDSEGVHASLILWDEQLPLANLFKEGDTLFIQKPFVVPNQEEMFSLEYGLASVISCRPHDPVRELVPSQTAQTRPTPVSVLKGSSGMLDYSTFPEQIFLTDIRSNMTRVTLFCIVTHVSPVEAFVQGNISGEKFTLTTKDSKGCQSITVYDDSRRYYQSLYSGQGIVLENLHTSGHNSTSILILETHQGGNIWNVSAMPGWLATKCLSFSVPVKDIPRYSNCVCKAVVNQINSAKGNYVIRIHGSCRNEVQYSSGRVSCQKCGIVNLNEMLNKPGRKNSPSSYWTWHNNLIVEIYDSNNGADASLTDQAAEQLLQMTVLQFAALLKNAQEQILESLLALEFTFGVSSFRGSTRVDAIWPTS